MWSSSGSEVANSWRTERWDSLRLLTPNWQCRLARPRLRRGRSRRFHDDAGGRRFHHRIREGDRRPGAVRHDGHIGAPHRWWIPRHYRPGRMALPDGRPRHGSVQRAARARLRGGAAVVRGDMDADGLPERGAARGGRGDGGRRVCDGRTDRGRNPAFRPRGHVGCRRARARAAHVPGPRHPLVDGGGWRARRALRRGGRHRSGPARAFDAARWFT